MRVRAAASIVLAALVATVVAGCSYVTPHATLDHYDPSEGVSATVGTVSVLNAVVLTEDGTDGSLVFTASNRGDRDVDLNLQYSADGAKTTLTVEVAAGTITKVGFDGDQLRLEHLRTTAGSMLPLYVQYGDVPGTEMLVPVLAGDLPYFESLLPTPAPTSTPVPTETATPPEPAPSPEA